SLPSLSDMSSRMPILATCKSGAPIKFLVGPAGRRSTPVFYSWEYRLAAYLEGNFPARENGHLASVLSARLIMSVRIMRRGPATISQAPQTFGGHFQWKIPTVFASP